MQNDINSGERSVEILFWIFDVVVDSRSFFLWNFMHYSGLMRRKENAEIWHFISSKADVVHALKKNERFNWLAMFRYKIM